MYIQNFGAFIGSKDGGVPAEEEKGQQVSHDSDDDDDGNGDCEAASVMELDTELEDDLCKLWDASINEVRKLIDCIDHNVYYMYVL